MVISSWWVPLAATRPSRRNSTSSAWSSSSGLAVMTTVVRPRAGLRQAPGDPGLGVGVHRARRLDQHQRLGVGQQRPGQRQALALAAGERPAALLDLAVQPLGQRLQDVLAARDRQRLEERFVVVVARRVELVAQHAGEQPGVVLADDDPAADGRQRQVGQRHAVQQDRGAQRTEPAEPVGQGGGLLGRAGRPRRSAGPVPP